jgi:hypothetical protein
MRLPFNPRNNIGSANVARSRRRWWRFFYQFSLRSLLVLTTVVATLCWWLLQPEVEDELLMGDELRLRRQVRRVPADEVDPLRRWNVDNEVAVISDGSWKLLDLHGDVFVDGNYARDRMQGRWTSYYAHGGKSAEGKVVRDVRSGPWREWNQAGQLVSEVTYRPIPARYFGYPDAWDSERHGPSRTWHTNGKLASEGDYADGRQSGNWKLYDVNGIVVEEGPFAHGKRHGRWRQRDAASQSWTETEYVLGRTLAEHHALLARLQSDLVSEQLATRYRAIERLAELGEHGVPLLATTLEQADDEMKLLALRALVRGDHATPELATRIRPWINHPDHRIAVRAMLGVFVAAPNEREGLYRKLIDAAADCPSDLKIETLSKLCEADETRRSESFASLIDAIAAANAITPEQWSVTHLSPLDPRNLILRPDVETILSLDVELVPLLTQALRSSSVEHRVIAAATIETLIERKPATRVSGKSFQWWDIPADLQPLVAAARHDADPLVRSIGEGIGQADSGHLRSASRGGGGGFF